MIRNLIHLLCSLALTVPMAASGQMAASDPPSAVVAAAESSFPEYGNAPTFDQILKSGGPLPSTIVIPRTFDNTPNGSVFGAPQYPSPHVMSIVGRSDFAATGVPTRRWTFPLVGNTFTVSIYLVHVTSVAIPGKDGVMAGQDIYVARAGGPITYKGQVFRGIDPNFQLFHLNEPYIFLGSKIADGIYKVDSDRVLKLEGSSIAETSMKHTYAAYFASKSPAAILDEISDAWALQNRGDRQVHP